MESMQKILRLFSPKTCSLVLLFLWLTTLFLLYMIRTDSTVYHNQVRTIINALDIVKAIDLYSSANDELPQSLEVLTPKYLPFVPSAEWGNSGWIYEIDNNEFDLSVGYRSGYLGSGASLYPVFYYSSSDKYWSLND